MNEANAQTLVEAAKLAVDAEISHLESSQEILICLGEAGVSACGTHLGY